MFNIHFFPLRCDDTELLTVSVSKDVITINGIDYDFSPLVDGDSLGSDAIESRKFLGMITRTGKDINVTLQMPYRDGAPESVTFPTPVSVKSGKVKVPTDIMEVK